MQPHAAYPDKAARVERVRQLRREGKTLGQIQYLTGVHRSTACRWLARDDAVRPRFDRRAWRASREAAGAVG